MNLYPEDRWPRRYKIAIRSRPGTRASRMDSGYLQWRHLSGKRYALVGALTALRVLSKRYSGSDLQIVRVSA